ncbi:MAG: superoxide dismutase [Propionibacteriaceae bacterium]|nr:superoxide dismutase [Propionibacteriaceae bacterium]
MKFRTGARLAVLGLATALAASLAPAVARAHGGPGGGPYPAVLRLPDGFRPEGIAIRGNTAYFGSLADGDIYAVSLRTGNGALISEGPGTPSVGLTVDGRGRLFVAGGPAGDARVVDTRTGEVLAGYPLAAGASFVNDVVLTRRTAWFTDSQNPVLYGLPLGRHGQLPDPADVIQLPLSGDYVHGPGFNLNGIAATPDGRALLAVQTSTGLLFRIDPGTGVTRTVDLGGYPLTNGDGLLVRGRTLYAVQNQLNQVAVFRLSRGGGSGTLQRTITSPGFDVPTTVAAWGRWLYLPNARFSTPPTPETTYTAVRVPR